VADESAGAGGPDIARPLGVGDGSTTPCPLTLKICGFTSRK
jgi:hypothetical protein